MIVSSEPTFTPPCFIISAIDLSKCWFVPMRPVTPFMIIPTLISFIKNYGLLKTLALIQNKVMSGKRDIHLLLFSAACLIPVGIKKCPEFFKSNYNVEHSFIVDGNNHTPKNKSAQFIRINKYRRS